MPLPSFDLVSTPLVPGVALLAASAGTGKTYTIAGLFLRLLLEDRLEVSQILVTTYTEAATAELRTRIWGMLQEALAVAAGGGTENATLRDLVAKYDPAEVQARLLAARDGFDEAAIFTIHGFCQRVLRDAAFESALPFDAELITDESALQAEIADDFWRQQYYGGDRFITALATQQGLNPGSLAKLLQTVSQHPDLTVLPSFDEARFLDLHQRLKDALEALRECWRSEEAAIRQELQREGWCKGSVRLGKNGALEAHLDQLAAGFMQLPHEDFAGTLALFSSENLAQSTRKRAAAPQHCLFALCDRLGPLLAEHDLAARAWFLCWARGEIARRKSERNVLSFGDLLTRLREALQSAGGERFAERLRAKYRAALVDEFQDTDPVQDAIIEHVFGRGHGRLLLIGDPKQAIYGFRGADVYCYLRAVDRVPKENCWTLRENYRSEARLVSAVNHVFNRAPGSFVVPGIAFDDAVAAGRADLAPLTIEGEREPPLTVWHWPSDEPIKAGEASRKLPRACAAGIARLLDGTACLGGKPVQPPQIAALVATHWQGRAVQQALLALGLPSVVLSRESVFKSHEANELFIVLNALRQPASEPLLRAALGTDLLGLTAAALTALAGDEAALETRMERFQSYRADCQRHGFAAAFRRFIGAEKVRTRLLAWADGERRLTNLLHLGELLHRAAAGRHLGAAALLKWFAEQRAATGPAADETELRLERDDAAVKIITLHRSKGLEFDIVIFPFSYGKATIKKPPLIYHDPAAGGRLTYALAEDPTARVHFDRESLAEQLRLFYVALTRARHACYFVWGQFNQCEVSAGSWLLHRPPETAPDEAAALKAHLHECAPQRLTADLEEFAATSGGAVRIAPLPELAAPGAVARMAAPPALEAALFKGRIRRDWRISSFSSLTSAHDSERPDYDAAAAGLEIPQSAEPAAGIHAFPSGRKPGTCLHEILQRIDFSAAAARSPAAEELVRDRLRSFGISITPWAAEVSECLQQVMRLELEPGLALAHLARGQCLTEMEFHLPVQALASPALEALLPEARGLSFEARRGLLKGYIDLVFEARGRFFIIDWKSNRLGAHAGAYGPEAVAAAMRQHHYGLQYHLYTVAVHRYLRARLPDYDYERHFGGVFYLFLRGAAAGLGVHRARPRRALVEALDAFFRGT